MFRRIFILAILVLPFATLSSEERIFELKSKMEGIDLIPFSDVYIDESSSLDFEKVSSPEFQKNFKPISGNSFGFTLSTYWLRLKVRNISGKIKSWYLEHDYPLFDLVEVYRAGKSSDPFFRGGDIFPYDKRPIDYKDLVIPITVESSEDTLYYIKFKSKSAMTIPVYAYTPKEFYSRILNEQMILGIYYGFMLVLFLYNLFLYLSTKNVSYLYYILYIASYSLFQASLNGFTFQYLWPNSIWWENVSMPFFIYFAYFWGLMFCRSFLGFQKSWRLLNYALYFLLAWSVIGSLFVFIINNNKLNTQSAVTFSFLAMLFLLVSGIYSLVKGFRSARYFLFAWTMFLIGIFLYNSTALGFLPKNFVTNWAIQIGSSLEVVLLSLALADKINELSLNLKIKLEELHFSKLKIEESEKRFRNLFNSSDDIIFVLDEDWKIKNINHALTKQTGIKTADVVGENFANLIYHSDDNTDYYRKVFILEKMEEFRKSQKLVRFQAEFRNLNFPEPKEVNISLQYIEHNQEREILGVAALLSEDILNKFMVSEKITFSINNYLQNSDIISKRLTNGLKKYCDANEIFEIRTCLREILINSIEHGNLEITFDEKTQAMMDDAYFDLIHERQNTEPYKNRKTLIEYTFTSERIGFRISDEGKGFDHRKYRKSNMKELAEDYVPHGRGIAMTNQIFDEVKYNEKGNQVVLVKYFNR